MICNIPSSKVLIYMGNDENTKKESFNFKLIGGEKQVEDDEEGEEE
jgi:hypothetical protein